MKNISSAARNAELELGRDSPDEDEGLEYIPRAVAEEVTNTHDGGLCLRRTLLQERAGTKSWSAAQTYIQCELRLKYRVQY